jgi:large subunit ribosomal protein L35
MLEHKSTARKTRLGQIAVVDDRDADNVSAMMPYS